MPHETAPKKFGHAEAFKIMQYQCCSCAQIEKIWNSRDGVTPFMISCKFCGNTAKHINWQEDLYAPDYKPAAGERFFLDLTLERAREIAKVVMEKYEHQTYTPEEMAVEIEDLAKTYFADGKSPDIQVAA